jgi:hypothetical protein
VTVTVVDAQPLIDAIKAAVTGVAYAEGKKPAVTAGLPYVVAWFDAGSVTNRSLRSRDGFELVGTFQCYGNSPESVRLAVRKVRAAVFGLFGATVAGRTVQMPEHLPGPPMDRDDDVDPPLWWQTDGWRFRAPPA